MLLRIANVFSREETARIRVALEQAAWQDGRVTAGYQSAKAKHNLQLAEDDPLAREIAEAMLQRLWQHPQFMSAALPSKVFPPLFNCYTAGGEFGYHIDNAVRQVRNSAERVRTDLSATLFFSDPDEYDGGDLVIQDTYGTQRVKFAAGDMVLYPSPPPAPPCKGPSRSRAAHGWLRSSGFRAWCARTLSARCFTRWIRPFSS